MPALQVVAKKPDGTSSPPSNEEIFTTPSAGAPVLTSADAWGPTSGQATATPTPGITFTSVRHHAVLAVTPQRTPGGELHAAVLREPHGADGSIC